MQRSGYPPTDELALLALEDGTFFWGKSVGLPGETFGELVFNTGMTGYQEVLTDPSYRGQIVVMTYPEIGIYGVNPEDGESKEIQVAGYVIHRAVRQPFNQRATLSFTDYLHQAGIVALEGVDTRALTRKIRTQGAMRGAISSLDLDPESLITRIRESPSMLGRNLAQEVSPRQAAARSPQEEGFFHVVLVDLGTKEGIVRDLSLRKVALSAVPYDANIETVLTLQPDGVLVSNGPGDPAPLHETIRLIRALLERRIPVARLAAKLLVGRSLPELLAPYWPFPVRPGLPKHHDHLGEILPSTNLVPTPWPEHYSVKEVVFPFGRFPGADLLLGPEMRSTGEVMSMGGSFPEAFAKAQIAAGNPLPTEGTVLVSLAASDRREGTALVSHLYDLGFQIVATQGTARALQAVDIPAKAVSKVGEGRPDVVDLIAQGQVNLVVNIPSLGPGEYQRPAPPLPATAEERGVPLPLERKRTVGYRMRTEALKYHLPYITTLAALRAAVAAIRSGRLPVRALNNISNRPREYVPR